MAALISLPARAAIDITVSGGKSSTPLEISITSGDTFTAIDSLSAGANLFLKFIAIWDNTVAEMVVDGPSNTIQLNNSTGMTATGSANVSGFTFVDLVVGFTGIEGFNTSDPIVLTTGSRVTDPLNLDYDTLGPVSGNVVVTDASGNVVSDTLTYNATIVPEPSTYAALGGLLALGLAAAWRRPGGRSADSGQVV